MGDILTHPPPRPPSLSLGSSSTTGSWKLWRPGPTLRGKGHFSGKDLWQDGSAEGAVTGTVLLMGRTQLLQRASGDAGCAPPGPLAPGLGARSCRWEGRSGRRPQSPDSLFQLSPPRCLPGPVWAPSPGHGGARGPRWARPGPEGPAALLLLRGGGRGEGLAPGPGALSSWVPSTTRSRTRRLQGCRHRLPAARRPPPPPPRPSSRPASFCRPPPSARFHGNWAMPAQTASLPRTPGDARLLRGARIPGRARARFIFPGSDSHAPRRGGARGRGPQDPASQLQDSGSCVLSTCSPQVLKMLRPVALQNISICLIIHSQSLLNFKLLRFFWVRPSVRCSSTISFQEIPYPFYRLETEAHSSKTTCLDIQGSRAPYWQPGLAILILVLLPQARAVPHAPQQTCTAHV